METWRSARVIDGTVAVTMVSEGYRFREWEPEPRGKSQKWEPGPLEGVPLEPDWYAKLQGCTEDDRCGCGYCPVCGGQRSARKALRRPLAAMKRAFNDHQVEVWMLTVDRIRTTNPEQLYRFNAALKVLGASLIEAGALGIVWVREAVVHPDEPTYMQCHKTPDDAADEEERVDLVERTTGEVCPLCDGTNKVPAAHLHAHGIMLVKRNWFLNFKWLNHANEDGGQECRLHDVRALDPGIGRVHVKRGKAKNAGHAVGYILNYVKRAKDDRQQPWMRRMAPGARKVESMGEMRAKVRINPTTFQRPFEDTKGHVIHGIGRSYDVRSIAPPVTKIGLGMGTDCYPRQQMRKACAALRKRGIPLFLKSRWDEDAEFYRELKAWEMPKRMKVVDQMDREIFVDEETGLTSAASSW